jgi:hypothetical protein
MTIYEIAERTKETAPHFFDGSTLRFFGRTMADFSVEKLPDGTYYISAISKDWYGNVMGKTERIFDPETNRLLMVKKDENKSVV